MYIDGVLGCVVGIMLIVGGYLFPVVSCTWIADKVSEWVKKRGKDEEKNCFLHGGYRR